MPLLQRCPTISAVISNMNPSRPGRTQCLIAPESCAAKSRSGCAGGIRFVASVAGLVGTTIQACTANRERIIAQRRFNDVRQLSSKLFDIDARVRRLPGAADTRRFIVDTSLDYLRRLGQRHPG